MLSAPRRQFGRSLPSVEPFDWVGALGAAGSASRGLSRRGLRRISQRSVVACVHDLNRFPISSLPSLQEEIHLNVLRQLQANPGLSQRELADALGVSLGKTNFCMQALLAKGFLKARNFRNRKNKSIYAYQLTPEGVAEKASLTKRFLKRKMIEYDALRHEIEGLQGDMKLRLQQQKNGE